MKDIKSYVIGFLTCACLFLVMGQTDGEEIMEWNVDGKVIIESNENGRYQSFIYKADIFTLDTRTAEMYTTNYKLKDWEKLPNIKPLNN